MTRVRIQWEETVTYNQVFEVDDIPPGWTGDQQADAELADKLSEAIGDQANFSVVEEVGDRVILDWCVVPQ